MDLTVEGGFDALTFAAVGERAGYSRGLVTARFGNKIGLIDALIDMIVNRWSHRNVLPRVEAASGLDGLLMLLSAVRSQADQDPRGLQALYSLTFQAASDETLRPRFARLHRTMRDDIAGLVRKGEQDGSIGAGHSPEAEAVMIVAELRGIGFQWLLDLEEFALVDHLDHLIDHTRRRLSASLP